MTIQTVALTTLNSSSVGVSAVLMPPNSTACQCFDALVPTTGTHGREGGAATAPAKLSTAYADVAVSYSAAVWGIGPIWVSKEELLRKGQ
jgi:hypothetical protein